METEFAKAPFLRTEVLRNPYASYHKMRLDDIEKYTADDLDSPPAPFSRESERRRVRRDSKFPAARLLQGVRGAAFVRSRSGTGRRTCAGRSRTPTCRRS